MNLNKSEALIITSKPNIYYFSKIDAEAQVFLLLTKCQKFVFSDARFIKAKSKSAREFTPVATDKNNIDLTYHKLLKFRKISRGLARLKPSKTDLLALRSQKSKRELICIKKAVKITEDILKEIHKIIMHKFQISEFDLKLEIHKQALNRGCESLAFPPIVAFGRNTAVPHHQPSKVRHLKRGDIVLIDLGVKYKNFCADLTRTFFTAPPTSHQIEIYNKVLAVQSQAIKKIKAGVAASKLYDGACAGFGRLAPHFTHDLGHGVGLEIHEHPNLKQKSPDVLKSGQVLTVEPGLYFSWGGVRIEDMVMVERNGCKVLTKFGYQNFA